MEIKYTLEILIKDIQDIENLVAKLQNSPEGSTLEIDLALSKLRNVYDILTVIRTDMVADKKDPEPVAEPGPSGAAEGKPAGTPGEQTGDTALEEKRTGAGKEEAMKTRGNAEILAEKFFAEASINENLGASRKPGMESKVTGQPIDSIGRNIGINDRFLIIRELFEGNPEGYGKLIDQLEHAGSLETALTVLEEHFPEAGEHEGVMILSGLIKRRYAGR